MKKIGIIVVFVITILIVITVFVLKEHEKTTKMLYQLKEYNKYILLDKEQISAQEFISLLNRVYEVNKKNERELKYELLKKEISESRDIFKKNENLEEMSEEYKEKFNYISVILEVKNPEYEKSKNKKGIDKYTKLKGEKILKEGQFTFLDFFGESQIQKIEEKYYSNGKIKEIYFKIER